MTAQTDFGPDDICRGQQHYKGGGPARAHVGCTFHGYDVPVAPAPDQDDEPCWRVGGNYNLHAYAAEPWDVDPSKDRPVATFHRPADAALAVARVNAHAALTARAEHAEAEVGRERETALLYGRSAKHHQRKAERLSLLLNRDRLALARVKAERDAARAELAAAGTTDGLGLLLTDVGRHIARHENRADRHLLRRVRVARARLAQEAPTTKDEE